MGEGYLLNVRGSVVCCHPLFVISNGVLFYLKMESVAQLLVCLLSLSITAV